MNFPKIIREHPGVSMATVFLKGVLCKLGWLFKTYNFSFISNIVVLLFMVDNAFNFTMAKVVLKHST